MASFTPIDRTKCRPGDLLAEWTRETEALAAKLRREWRCPNCGGWMVYGEPCQPAPKEDT